MASALQGSSRRSSRRTTRLRMGAVGSGGPQRPRPEGHRPSQLMAEGRLWGAQTACGRPHRRRRTRAPVKESRGSAWRRAGSPAPRHCACPPSAREGGEEASRRNPAELILLLRERSDCRPARFSSRHAGLLCSKCGERRAFCCFAWRSLALGRCVSRGRRAVSRCHPSVRRLATRATALVMWRTSFPRSPWSRSSFPRACSQGTRSSGTRRRCSGGRATEVRGAPQRPPRARGRPSPASVATAPQRLLSPRGSGRRRGVGAPELHQPLGLQRRPR